MLSGATLSAAATVGTAVFRMVVSSASMKKATATSHGSIRLTDSSGEDRGGIGWSIVRRFDRSHPRLEAEQIPSARMLLRAESRHATNDRRTHTTATFTQWIGGSESNRQSHF